MKGHKVTSSRQQIQGPRFPNLVLFTATWLETIVKGKNLLFFFFFTVNDVGSYYPNWFNRAKENFLCISFPKNILHKLKDLHFISFLLFYSKSQKRWQLWWKSNEWVCKVQTVIRCWITELTIIIVIWKAVPIITLSTLGATCIFRNNTQAGHKKPSLVYKNYVQSK